MKDYVMLCCLYL